VEGGSRLIIEIDWSNDERSMDVNKYLVDPDSDKESRRKAFLGGWTRYLNNGSSDSLDGVTWVGLGMVWASVLEDIPLDQREGIYRLLLGQYVWSNRVKHWTDEEREEALRLVSAPQPEGRYGQTGQPLSPFSVYTIRHQRDLDEMYRRRGEGGFDTNRLWRTGRALFQQAKGSGQRMPVIFASADVTDKLVYYAMLSDIELDETNSTTRYEFTELQKVEGDLPLSTLKLRSTNRPLSDNYIRPYAICLTPSFVN
jgi:hypothetical protein